MTGILLSRPVRCVAAGVVVALVLVAAPACSQHRAPRPTAEESLPPPAEREVEDLPQERSSLPGEEAIGTGLLIALLLAAAAGMAYLSFVVIPDAID